MSHPQLLQVTLQHQHLLQLPVHRPVYLYRFLLIDHSVLLVFAEPLCPVRWQVSPKDSLPKTATPHSPLNPNPLASPRRKASSPAGLNCTGTFTHFPLEPHPHAHRLISQSPLYRLPALWMCLSLSLLLRPQIPFPLLRHLRPHAPTCCPMAQEVLALSRALRILPALRTFPIRRLLRASPLNTARLPLGACSSLSPGQAPGPLPTLLPVWLVLAPRSLLLNRPHLLWSCPPPPLVPPLRL